MLRSLAATLLILPALCARAQARDFSATLTTTPVQVVPRASTGRAFLRLINVEPSGGASAWCSRALTTTLAANAAGAYELQAGGGGEQYAAPGYVPPDAVWCAAASGTVRLTAEASQ